MAIPIAKLTIVVGAGLLGSIIVKEGRMSDVPNFISGAFKIMRKHLQEDKNNSSSAKKGGDDYLMIQVNSLRQQLQSLQQSGPLTIINGSGRGYGTFGITTTIVIGAVGYIYIRWKGWKISDMMFVTKRSLSDACNNVAKQLDLVSSSISTTKRHLSSRIDRVDCTLEDCLEVTAATKDEVSNLHGELGGFHVEVESVHRAVQTLESKLVQIEESQDFTTQGVSHLCRYVMKLENKRPEPPKVLHSNSFRPAIEQAGDSPISRSGSLPPIAGAAEFPSSSTPETPSPRVLQSSRTATVSFKDVQGISFITRSTSLRQSPSSSNGSDFSSGASSQAVEEPRSAELGSSNAGRFGWKLPSLGLLARTRSSSSAM